MRTITADKLEGISTGSKALNPNRLNIRKGVIMNLISNIMIKDYDTEKKKLNNMKLKQGQGFSIYKALEFSKENTQQSNQNLYFELICNRII